MKCKICNGPLPYLRRIEDIKCIPSSNTPQYYYASSRAYYQRCEFQIVAEEPDRQPHHLSPLARFRWVGDRNPKRASKGCRPVFDDCHRQAHAPRTAAFRLDYAVIDADDGLRCAAMAANQHAAPGVAADQTGGCWARIHGCRRSCNHQGEPDARASENRHHAPMAVLSQPRAP